MKAELIEKAYAVAKERYAAVGVDTDAVLDQLQKQQISLHCWQTDDVVGFERNDALSGGIQTTGNYPGRARNIDEVRKDIEFVKTLIAGNHRLNLHEIYGDFGNTFVDRDQVEVKHFESWMQWAKENNMKLDFNSSSFSHPKSGSLTLSNPDKAIRDFWIEHTKRCRRIADAMGKAQNDPCIMNIWEPEEQFCRGHPVRPEVHRRHGLHPDPDGQGFHHCRPGPHGPPARGDRQAG